MFIKFIFSTFHLKEIRILIYQPYQKNDWLGSKYYFITVLSVVLKERIPISGHSVQLQCHSTLITKAHLWCVKKRQKHEKFNHFQEWRQFDCNKWPQSAGTNSAGNQQLWRIWIVEVSWPDHFMRASICSSWFPQSDCSNVWGASLLCATGNAISPTQWLEYSLNCAHQKGTIDIIIHILFLDLTEIYFRFLCFETVMSHLSFATEITPYLNCVISHNIYTSNKMWPFPRRNPQTMTPTMSHVLLNYKNL